YTHSTAIDTLSLHDALPILKSSIAVPSGRVPKGSRDMVVFASEGGGEASESAASSFEAGLLHPMVARQSNALNESRPRRCGCMFLSLSEGKSGDMLH